ncbi:MAG: hypothetical protein VKI63_08480 [Cyanobium sp.]|nr:hypothetical protein [Cyanobium sp.]
MQLPNRRTAAAAGPDKRYQDGVLRCPVRLTRLRCLLGLFCAVAQSPALAAPLVWQLDAGSAAPGNLPDSARSQQPPARALTWTLDTTPEPTTTELAGPAQPVVAPQGSTVPPGAIPAQQATPAQPTPQDTKPGELASFGVALQPPYPSPYIGGAVPTAYIGGWGNYWFGLSGGTPGKLRDGAVDASFNAGIGFGDFYRTLAVELDWGIGSVKNFNANGGFSASAGRLLVDEPRFQLAAGGGLLSFYTYGNEGNPEPASGYGVISMATPLRPGGVDFAQVLQLSFGGGGNQFAYLNPETFTSNSFGLFASLGLEITRNVGLSLGWSNRGTNVNLSYAPFRGVPIYLNVVGADLFNISPSGTVAVFSISWGDDFRTALF